MNFSDKLRYRRGELKMSQSTLAELADISLRSVQNYESGERYPANIMIVRELARALGTSCEYLLDDRSKYVIDAGLRGGTQAAMDVDRLLSDIQGLFAGGSLDEENKDKLMRAINEIYWESKEKSGK